MEEKFIKNLKDEIKDKNDIQLKENKIYLDENDDEIDLAKSGNTSIHNVEGLLNLSNNCKSIEFEKNNSNSPVLEIKAQDQKEKEVNKNSKFTQVNKCLEEDQANEAEKRIMFLEEENFSLRKTNETLIQELNKCKLNLSKVSYEKFSLFSELNEVLESLSRVNLDELNKFYLESLSYNLNKNSIYSAMGIKYNILSASNTLGLFAFNHSLSLHLGNNDNLKKKANLGYEEKKNYLGQLFSEKYLQNIREKFHKYDDELNNFVYNLPERIDKKDNNALNKNSNRKNVTYQNSKISSVCFDSETRTDL